MKGKKTCTGCLRDCLIAEIATSKQITRGKSVHKNIESKEKEKKEGG